MTRKQVDGVQEIEIIGYNAGMTSVEAITKLKDRTFHCDRIGAASIDIALETCKRPAS